MSGLVGKRVLADVPGLGEVMRVRVLIRARSRALASRGTSLLRGPFVGRRRTSRVLPVSWRLVSSSAAIQRSAQNWHGLGESDCLIKTKHCDGPSGC